MRRRLVVVAVIALVVIALCVTLFVWPRVLDNNNRTLARARLKKLGPHWSWDHYLYLGYTSKTGDGLSWRVMILDKIGHPELHKQFHRDEPWDSEHNKTLIDRMPDVYESPGKPAGTGMTYLRSFIGQQAFFPSRKHSLGSVPSRRMTDTNDGLFNMLYVAEAAEPVIWTKPDELEYDEQYYAKERPPLPKLGGVFSDGFHGLMADGTVLFFPNSLTTDEMLRRAILVNDFTRDEKPEEYQVLNPIRQANGGKLLKPFTPPTKPKP